MGLGWWLIGTRLREWGEVGGSRVYWGAWLWGNRQGLREGSDQAVTRDEQQWRWFHATVAYDGTNYGGWQRQPNAVTIQQKLEEAIAILAGYRVTVVGSGRTDSGVHAEGQVASFALHHWKAEAEALVPSINRRLPSDIVVRSCRDACERFHAQRHAVSKWYRYTIRRSRVPDALQHRFHWQIGRRLNVEAMQEACTKLIGEHDFAGFQAIGAPRKTTVRTISRLELSLRPALDGEDLLIDVASNGFLYNMVRNIVGTLVEIGTGRFSPDHMLTMLANRQRAQGGQTAPSRGLCLMSVSYPDTVFRPFPGHDSELPSVG